VNKVNSYSLIRKEPIHKPPDGYSLTAFYEALLKPPVVFSFVTAYFVIFHQANIISKLDKAAKGDGESVLYLSLLFFSIIAGIRIIQSLYLAKRDYQHSKANLVHVLIFGCVVAFTGGGNFFLLNGKLPLLLGLNLFCAVAGLINFIYLYSFEIPKYREKYDYLIERKIQLCNVVTFLYIVGVFSFILYSKWIGNTLSDVSISIAVASTYIPIIINIIHSQDLSLRPKFMIHNKPDKPANQVSLFRSTFWRTSANLKDSDILAIIHDDAPENFRDIELVRIRPSNIDYIVSVLIDEFWMVYQYIFNTEDRMLVDKALKISMLAAGGLGRYGFLNFYMIRSKGNNVGFVMLQTSHLCLLYRVYEAVVLPFRLLFLGCRPLLAAYSKIIDITRIQAEPEEGEICINYLVIYPSHRLQGYGKATINLLIKALIHSINNDIECSKITLFVRESNHVAKSLFQKAGFNLANWIEPPAHTPLSRLGKLEYKHIIDK
jgi:ribosomal protein S18 acetylase RimI-like enzyme